MKKNIHVLLTALTAVTFSSIAYSAASWGTNSILTGTDSEGKLNWLDSSVWTTNGKTKANALPGTGSTEAINVQIGRYADDIVYLSGNANTGDDKGIGNFYVGGSSYVGVNATLEINNNGYLKIAGTASVGDRMNGTLTMTGGTFDIGAGLNLGTGYSNTTLTNSLTSISGTAKLIVKTTLAVGNDTVDNMPKTKLSIQGSQASITAATLTLRRHGTLEFIADSNGISTIELLSGNFQIFANALLANPTDLFSLDMSAYSGVPKSFILIDANATHAATAQFIEDNAATIVSSALYRRDLYSMHLSWDATNHDLVLDLRAIPEPATYAALIGLGVLAFVIYRRRKS